MPKLASDSCGARDTEGPWKGSRREVEWRWVANFSLHVNSRPRGGGVGGVGITGMAERALREEVWAGSACLPIMWEDFGLKLLIPE